MKVQITLQQATQMLSSLPTWMRRSILRKWEAQGYIKI